MVSVYLSDAPGFRCIEATDAALRTRALDVVASTFPETAGSVELAHVIRWPSAIAQFPPGRLTEVAAVRARLAAWDAPIEVAGDWLDGVASESAVRTGQDAAERLALRVQRAAMPAAPSYFACSAPSTTKSDFVKLA
jgi:protoporphyrinogen oxidase